MEPDDVTVPQVELASNEAPVQTDIQSQVDEEIAANAPVNSPVSMPSPAAPQAEAEAPVDEAVPQGSVELREEVNKQKTLDASRQQIAQKFPAQEQPKQQAPIPEPPKVQEPPKEYTTLDYLNALWHENDFYVLYDTMRDQYNNGAIDHTPDPDFNPVEAAQGTWAEGKLDHLINLHNRAEFNEFIAEGQEHIENDKILDSMGWAGIPVRFINGMVSPAIVIPGMMGPKAWGLATRMAVGGAVAAGVMEPWYRANDPTRDNNDSLMAISASAVGSVLLGKGLNYAAEKLGPVVERIRQARGEAEPIVGEQGNNVVVNPPEEEFTAYTSDNPFGPEAPAVTKEMRLADGEKVVTDGENVTPPVKGEMNGVEGGVEVAPPDVEAKTTREQLRENILQGRNLEAAPSGPSQLEPVKDRLGNIIDGIARTKAGNIAADVITPIGRLWHLGTRSAIEDIMLGSYSKMSRATLLDLADTAYRTADQELGEVRTLGGGSVEVEKRMEQDIALYDSIRGLDTAYAEHRFGSADKEPTLRVTGSDYWGIRPKPADALSYEDFNKRVFMALNMGDKDVGAPVGEQALPEVEKAAKAIRQVLSTWEKRAQKVKLPDGSTLLSEELGTPMGALSYMPHIFDPVKIDAAKPAFIDMFYKSLMKQHEMQVASRDKIKLYYDALKSSDEHIETLNKIIDGGQDKLDNLALRQEEVRRFNKYAYGRSEKMTADIDKARAEIRSATDRIAPQLEKLERLAQSIKEERDNLPHIKEMENSLFNIIGANGKLRNSKSAFEQIAGAEDLVNGLDGWFNGVKAGIKESSGNIKLAMSMPDAATLKALREEQSKIKKAIRPYTNVIRKNREAINGWMETRGPLAKGGAVFETEIRNRGNSLANRETAYIATIEDAKSKLATEINHNNNMRELLEKHVTEWQGKSNKEAKASLAARAEAEAERNAKMEEGSYKGRGERLTSADAAVEAFARRAINRTDLNLTGKELEDQLQQEAQEIADDIRYAANNRMTYEGDKSRVSYNYNSGNNDYSDRFMGRTLPINFNDKLPFLKTDIRDVMAAWARSVPTDTIFAEKMGSLDLADRKSLIDNDYLELRKAAEQDLADKKINKIEYDRRMADYERQQKIDKDRIQNIAERLRGIHTITPDMTTSKAAAFARDLQNISTIASLGRATLSSIVDAGGAASMRWGMGTVFKEQYFPFIKALSAMKVGEFDAEVRRQAKDLGIGIETAMTLMRAKMPEIVQGPGNPFSKGLSYATSRYMLLNMLMPWTDGVKAWGVTAATRVFGEAASRVANGKATKEDLQRLFDANIPEKIAAEIGRQYDKHAADNLNIGFKFPNLDKWDMTPEAQEARRYFRLGLNREGNTIVMTPGVATGPIWTSNKLLAPIFQFKNYAWRAHEVMFTSNMQNLNMKLLGGLAWSGGLATLALFLQKVDRGEEFPDDPMQILKEVSDLASWTPIYSDINKQFSSMTNGQLDAWRFAGVESPYMRAGDRTQVQAVLGPAFGLVGNGFNSAIDLAMGNGNGSTYHNLRKMMPGQNHFLAWPLYDLAEAAAVDAAEVKPTKKQKTMMENWGY